jgi:hypothetical protein
MNFFAAGNLFDNPLVLLAIVLLGALSSWLMKRRQRSEAANRYDGDERSPSPQAQDRSEPEPDMQEILRRLLGGEPPPRVPLPPPIFPVMREAQLSEDWSDEEQFEPQRTWINESQEVDQEARQLAQQTAEQSRQRTASAQASATRIQASERHEKSARRFAQLKEQGKHPATVMSTARGCRSRPGARAVSSWRDARTVRHAFVASLVFGLPKAFET